MRHAWQERGLRLSCLRGINVRTDGTILCEGSRILQGWESPKMPEREGKFRLTPLAFGLLGFLSLCFFVVLSRIVHYFGGLFAEMGTLLPWPTAVLVEAPADVYYLLGIATGAACIYWGYRWRHRALSSRLRTILVLSAFVGFAVAAVAVWIVLLYLPFSSGAILLEG